jgi:APA family basic amino acid/polyamine antiporter
MSETSLPASGQALQAAYARNATGLVREIRFIDQVLFNAASTAPLGAALVVNLFALTVFPQSNLYLAILVAIVLGVFVWTTFALMSAVMPRVGGDYTYNSRILHPTIALGANLCEFLSAALSTGFWGYWVAYQGLSPAFTVIGGVTGNSTLTSWGATLATNQTALFVVATLSVGLISVLSAMGTKVVMRTMSVLFLIATAGFVISMLFLLFSNSDSFKTTVDNFAGSGSYDKVVAAGATAGLYPTNGYSGNATFGALFYGISATIWIWWGTYMSAEFRGAGQRARQLRSIVGTGVVQGLLILAGFAILVHGVGYNFLVSALAGNFSGPGSGAAGTASYAYFAALVAGSSIWVTLLAAAFVGWWLPGLYINMAMPQRAILTYAFDNLLPKRLAAVNERTHTPVVAIVGMFIIGTLGAAWTAYSTSFLTVYSILVLFAVIPVIFTGVAAFLMRWRRPDLYKNSAAQWRLFGIEILPIAGLGCAAVGALFIFLVIYFRAQLLPNNFAITMVAPFGVFAVAAVWYWFARSYRKQREGINIDLQYRVIPPE